MRGQVLTRLHLLMGERMVTLIQFVCLLHTERVACISYKSHIPVTRIAVGCWKREFCSCIDYFRWMSALPTCAYASVGLVPQEVRRVCLSLDLGTEDCKLLCGCWELNPGSLQEQRVLLTPEPSF